MSPAERASIGDRHRRDDLATRSTCLGSSCRRTRYGSVTLQVWGSTVRGAYLVPALAILFGACSGGQDPGSLGAFDDGDNRSGDPVSIVDFCDEWTQLGDTLEGDATAADWRDALSSADVPEAITGSHAALLRALAVVADAYPERAFLDLNSDDEFLVWVEENTPGLIPAFERIGEFIELTCVDFGALNSSEDSGLDESLPSQPASEHEPSFAPDSSSESQAAVPLSTRQVDGYLEGAIEQYMQSPKLELPGPSVSLPINADDMATLVMYDHHEPQRIIDFMIEQNPDYSSEPTPEPGEWGARTDASARMFGRFEVVYDVYVYTPDSASMLHAIEEYGATGPWVDIVVRN